MCLKARELKMRNIIAYGSGDIYGGGAFFIIGLLFLIFMTDIVGLPPVLAGTVIMVGEVWDAITDPIMGIISDRTRSKFGRRRVYFLWGIIPCGISFMLLWIDISIGGQFVKFLYYMIMYIIFNGVFTMIMVPYNAMPSEMCDGYKERSRLVGVRMIFSLFGAFLGGVLPTSIINTVGNERGGYMIMGMIFALIFSAPWYFVFRGTWEKPIEVRKDKKVNTLKDIMRGFNKIGKNRTVRAHIGMFLCAYVALDVFMALFVYYIKYYMEIPQFHQIILGIFIVVQVLSMMIVAKECSKHGNGKTYRMHLLIWILGMGILGFVIPTSTAGTMFIVIVMIAYGASGGMMIPYNNIAFVVDCDEIVCKKRREGVHAGLMTFVRKTAQAVAIFFVGVALEWIGYVSSDGIGGGVLQSDRAIIGIKNIFIGVPIVLLIIGVLISYKFKVTPYNHKIIINEIKRLREGGEKEEMDKHVKQVIKETTGYDYSQIWSE